MKKYKIKWKNVFIATCISLAVIGAGSLLLSSSEAEGLADETSSDAETEESTDETSANDEPETVNLGKFKLTAYCACDECCGEWGKHRPTDSEGKPIVKTAGGYTAKQGVTVAADPAVLPYGTKILINNHEYIVQDCGGAIKDNAIDIYFDDHDQALEFGVQEAEVYELVER